MSTLQLENSRTQNRSRRSASPMWYVARTFSVYPGRSYESLAQHQHGSLIDRLVWLFLTVSLAVGVLQLHP